MTVLTLTAPLARHLTAWPDPDQLAAGSVVTMGVFDGFHRGHRALVQRARTRAAGLRLPSVLLTFDPHPLLVTCPRAGTTPAAERRRACRCRPRPRHRPRPRPALRPRDGRDLRGGVHPRGARRATARASRRGRGELPLRPLWRR
ncbi:hypothetical protein LP418_05285 [Nocardioides sp. B-3]|nr:hypothetical protein [Nocardioides sp. B-3]UUZ60334.1 hypothetical protein LP418_05285 [Nocardioides sp. B-3]